MKNKLIVLSMLSAAVLLNSGCVSTGAFSPVVSDLAPLAAEVAQARIAKEVLDNNPDAEGKLIKVSNALSLVLDEARGQEISEAVIRAFVAKRSAEWGLTAPEEKLIVRGLLLTRDSFIKSTGAGIVVVGDPRVKIWIEAIRNGIDAGIVAHHRKTTAPISAADKAWTGHGAVVWYEPQRKIN